MPQALSDQVAECLQRAAEAQARANAILDKGARADYARLARSWRALANSHQFQEATLCPDNHSRQKVAHSVPADDRQQSPLRWETPQDDESDILDRLARLSERIRPWSITALGMAAAALGVGTLIRIAAGWGPSELLFGTYLPSILIVGLLASVPAASVTAGASILILTWMFIPPYFEFKWLAGHDLNIVLFSSASYLVIIYFAYCCRLVLRRLRRREIANETLTRELQHRSKNLFAIVEVIVQKSLAGDRESAKKIIERLRSIQYANELLVERKGDPIHFTALLSRTFSPYGVDRLNARGLDFSVAAKKARHLTLMFHELATNAAKYGALSCADGKIVVDWHWTGQTIALTWKEIGGPTVAGQNPKGFGSQLIALCVEALSGTMESNLTDHGFTCSMVLRIGD